MVESTSQEELLEYNENKIVESLEREINCPENIAKRIAKSVTTKISKLELEIITTSLIRAFVNVELYAKGFDKELKSDTNVIIPYYDITQMIENTTKENGNTTHHPESINLNIAERVLKEYALNEIFPKDISQAHLEGKIHIHDLGMVDRLYAFSGEENYLAIRNKNTLEEFIINISALYELLNKEYILQNDIYCKISNIYEVQDKNGWTDLEKIVKIIEKKDIYEIVLETNNKIYVTEEHPCIKIVNEKEIVAPVYDLKIGDIFNVQEK